MNEENFINKNFHSKDGGLLDPTYYKVTMSEKLRMDEEKEVEWN